MKHEARNSEVDESNGACSCPDCRLSRQGPPAELREKAVAIWCGTYYADLAREMGRDEAAECEAAFAFGFEKGMVTAMLRPEWAQAFYLKLREYYLMTHTATDLAVWEDKAEETCRAIPLTAEVPPAEKCLGMERQEPFGHRHGSARVDGWQI